MRTAYHYLISLSVRLSVYVCVPFVVFTDCESCTTPISTNPGSMEAGEYGLTRGTCFVAHRLEVVAVAGLMWISWCVLGGANLLVSFFSILLFFERTRHTASMRPPCLIYLSTIKEAIEARGAHTCSRPYAFEEKIKSEKKERNKSRRTQNTPRSPQQPGDRDHVETACDETRPTR